MNMLKGNGIKEQMSSTNQYDYLHLNMDLLNTALSQLSYAKTNYDRKFIVYTGLLGMINFHIHMYPNSIHTKRLKYLYAKYCTITRILDLLDIKIHHEKVGLKVSYILTRKKEYYYKNLKRRTYEELESYFRQIE